MYASDATDHETVPYNTAYVRDDRRHLYERFDVDPSLDGGQRCPKTGERDAPADYAQRRAAILSFYGHRCGRCLAPIARRSDGDAGLGYLYSLAEAIDEPVDRWSLDQLVAVCEPCYEVLSIQDRTRLERFGTAYGRSQQFPQWLGDPRVAVERIPLTGREVWVREQLERRQSSPATTRTPHESINRPVAESACLARETSTATAVAYGEELSTDAWQPLPETQRLTDKWNALDTACREAYERRAKRWVERLDAAADRDEDSTAGRTERDRSGPDTGGQA